MSIVRKPENSRNYLYVIPTTDYVKFGISANPARRLAEHRIELFDPHLRFSDVWHSSIDKYKRVEKIAKIILEDFDQDTPERIYVSRSVVIEAIQKAADCIAAPLIRFDALLFNEEADFYKDKPRRRRRVRS